MNAAALMKRFTPLEAKVANFCFEIGAYLSTQFPDMTGWELLDPDENPMKESYIGVLVRFRHRNPEEYYLACTDFKCAFQMVGENRPVSTQERIDKWLSDHAATLLETGRHEFSFAELGNDASFIADLSEEIAMRGYDVNRVRTGLVLEKIEE